MNYYPHHIGDFNNSTRHLNRIERSVYRDLLELYYDSEAPLNSDISILCRKIIATSEQELTAVEQVLTEFFELTDLGYVNKRCQEIVDGYQNSIHNKSKAGKASAKARKTSKSKPSKQSTGVQQVFNRCSTGVHNQEPITNNQEPRTKESRTFTPPENLDVYNYFLKQDLTEVIASHESTKFINHYQSNGWLVGKNKMKDWKAAARGWLSRRGNYEKNNGNKPNIDLKDTGWSDPDPSRAF